MPDNQLPIQFPIRGIDENGPHGAQSPDTCSEGVNMRAIDPVTGRVRGAQRSGLSQFTTVQPTGLGKIQHVASVGYAASMITHTQIDNLNFDEGSADDSLIGWQIKTGNNDSSYDVATDRRGNVYALLEGSIEKYSADGVKLAIVDIPLNSAQTLLRHIEVTLNNLVVCVAKNPQRSTGTAFGFLEVERDGNQYYTPLWQIQLDGQPLDFRISGNTLYVLAEKPPTEVVGEHSEVIMVSGIDGPDPILSTNFAAPAKPASMAVGPQGAVYVTCPPYENRTVTPEGFTDHTLDWVPHEYTLGDSRIYSWIDPTTLLLADGAAVSEIPYRRTHSADNGTLGITEIEDDTLRPLINEHGLGDQRNRFAPRYDPVAFGTMGGIRFNGDASPPAAKIEIHLTNTSGVRHELGVFDSWEQATSVVGGAVTALQQAVSQGQTHVTVPPAGTYHLHYDYALVPEPTFVPGQGLVSRPNIEEGTKTLAGDKLPKSQAIIPAVNTGVFMVGMVIRCMRNPDPIPEIVFQHKGETFQFGIAANMAEGDNFNAGTSGSLTFFYSNDNDPQDPANREDAPFSTVRWNSSSDNATNAVVVVFIHDGASDEAFLRVNGELYHRWTTGSEVDTSNGVRGFSSFGGYVKGYNSALDFFPQDMASFNGWVGEIVTVLGGNNAAIHDQLFAHPQLSGCGTPDVASNVTTGTHHSFGYYINGSISEWEELEGYLAHKHGISHLLPNSDLNASITGSYEIDGSQFYDNAHPYGGTANPPDGSIDGDVIDTSLTAVRNDGPILAKYAADGGLRWALNTHGVGYGVEVDNDGDVLTVGPYLPSLIYGDNDGLRGPVGGKNVTARKVIDLGSSYALNERRQGIITFSAACVDGDTVTVTLGSTTTIFEFDDDSTVTAGNVAVDCTGHTLAGESSAALVLAAQQEFEIVQTNWPSEIIVWQYASGDPSENVYFDLNLAAFLETTSFSLAESTAGARMSATDFAGGNRTENSWEFWTEATDSPSRDETRVHIDDHGDLYFPQYNPGGACQARKLDGNVATGVTERLWDLCMHEAATDPVTYRYQAFGIALSPNPPVYSSSTITGPEFLYVGTGPGDASLAGVNPTLHKFKLVDGSRNLSQKSPRAFRNVSVRSGNIEVFDRTGITSVTNGANALGVESNLVTSTVLFNKLYLSDGLTAVVYDPKENSVSDFEAEQGSTPKRIRLLEGWRGRLVAVSEDDPQNWMMSRLGDPLDWNEYPEVVTAEQAITGNNPRSIGKNPDIITSIIPYNDVTLLLGGDHTIHVMHNEPLAVALGGYGRPALSLVSDVTGIAFGSSWTKSPEGEIYFFGSKGGVFRYVPGGMPQRISLNRIERQLADVDLDNYRIELAWNYREDSLHILQLPVGSGGTLINSWCWERRTDSWWRDEWATTAIQPTAVTTLDGDDPADRRLLFGTEGGDLLYWDELAYNDFNERIDSKVTIGPVLPWNEPYAARFYSIKPTLSSQQHGCYMEGFASGSPEDRGSALWSRDLGPGANDYILNKTRGSYFWLRLRNAALDERWAYESVMLKATRAGRKRVRR